MLTCQYLVFDKTLPAEAGTLPTHGALRRCGNPATVSTSDDVPLCDEHADATTQCLCALPTRWRKDAFVDDKGHIIRDGDGDVVLPDEGEVSQ